MLTQLPLLAAGALSALGPRPTASLAHGGVVVGTHAERAHQPGPTAGVDAYLGIPFAQSPPVRFAPPQRVVAAAAHTDAAAFRPACIQAFTGSGETPARTRDFFNNPGGVPPDESEDCLYLNVFAPRGAGPRALKPVMFWLYGGELAFGTASLAHYDGSSLAGNEDVVVVTSNYRTNIFGFSGAAEIRSQDHNAGFLDQRMALQWVQDNIRAFGGDPDRVTLFGQSAGGYSIKQLIAAPPDPLPFRAAIIQSQGFLGPRDSSEGFDRVAERFGCVDEVSRIECVRKVPAVDLRRFIEEQNLSFGPVMNDVTAVQSVEASLQSNISARVPILMGTNHDETTIFLAAAGLTDGVSALEAVLRKLRIDDARLRSTLLNRAGATAVQGLLTVANRIATDTWYTCATAALSAILAANGHSVWRYRYSSVPADTALAPSLGAYHASEIPAVFGTYPQSSPAGIHSVSAYVQKVWAGFARHPQNGPGWAKAGTAADNQLGDIGFDEAHNVTLRPWDDADGLCGLLTPFSHSRGLVD